MERLGNVSLIQGDGSRAEVLYQAVSHTAEAEVSLARQRFHGGAAVSGASACHWMIIHLDQSSRMCCRIGKRRSDHVAAPGTIVFCPAGVDISAESDTQVDALLLGLPREPFGLLAVERARPNADFTGVLLARDDTLLAFARELADRARVSPGGRDTAWRDLSAEVFEHVFETYLLGERADRRGVLTAEMLARIHRYVDAHLADPIEVDTLADVVQKSRSHFPRLFRRSVGLSPYQYVVRRRLQRAVQLIREGHLQLAQVAAETGFVDQSHLTHWMQRVYGLSPARVAGPPHTRRNLQDR